MTFRQLAALVGAGLPLLRALQMLGRQVRHPAMRRVLAALADNVRRGGLLSDGLASQGGVFSEIDISLVAAGEGGGRLGEALARVADRRERLQATRSRIQAALAYPAVVLLVTLGIVGALLLGVVPRFQEIFASQLEGQPLPGLTQVVIAVADALRRWWFLVPASLFLLPIIAAILARNRRSRGWRDRVLLHAPGLGGLLRRMAAARMARTLGGSIEGGVPLLEAMAMASATAGNLHLAAALKPCRAAVEGGTTLSAAFRRCRLLPGVLVDLVEVGEESGSLGRMLERAASLIDEEVERTVGTAVTLLEPLLIVAMAAVVGVMVIALFLPVIRIIQVLA